MLSIMPVEEMEGRTFRYGCLFVIGVPIVVVTVITVIGVIWKMNPTGPAGETKQAKREVKWILGAIPELGEWAPNRPRTGKELARKLLEREAKERAKKKARRLRETFLESCYPRPRPRRGFREIPKDIYAEARRRFVKLIDPWGKRYRITVNLEAGGMRRDGIRWGEIIVRAAGPDGRFGTKDDVFRRYVPPWTDEPLKPPTVDREGLTGGLVNTPDGWDEWDEDESPESSPTASPSGSPAVSPSVSPGGP